MKLRNLMYATMIACAFASCSKDDEVIKGDEPTAKGTGSLTVEVATDALTKAAAADGAFDGETKINDLTVVLYDTDGAYIAHSEVKSAIGVAKLTATFRDLVLQEVQLMAYANMSFDPKEKKTLGAMETTAIPFKITEGAVSAFAADNLPMSGKSDKFTLKNGDNYYGYKKDEIGTASDTYHAVGAPLELVRNVARVHLESITLDMTKRDYTAGTAKLDINDISIVNARQSAFFFKTNADAGYYTGDKAYFHNVQNAVEASFFTHSVTDVTLTQTIGVNKPKEDFEIIAANGFYVLQNTFAADAAKDDATMLVVKGTFSLDKAVNAAGQSETAAPKMGYYPVKIGLDGVEANKIADGVNKNKIYKINLTVAGNGEVGPDGKAHLFVVCKVQDWETITQTPGPIM